ncbi:MAG: HAMP domain-containing sensor histidine kinase [Pseudomonadota bacterium]
MLIGAVVAALSALLVAYAYSAVVSELTRQRVTALQAEAAALATLGEQTGPAGLAAALTATPDRAFRVADAAGQTLAGTLAAPDQASPKSTYRVVGQQGPFADGTLIARVDRELRSGGALSLARSLQPVAALANRLLYSFLAALIVLGVVALAASYLLAQRTARRVAALTQESEEIMAGDLARRLGQSADQDELDQLACAVNRMLDRIAQLMVGLKEVSDNVAHDLKTPLNRMRARAETVLRTAKSDGELRDGLTRTIDDADALIRTFNAMLLVARLEAGAVTRSFETFDLSALMGDIAELYGPLIEDEGGTFEAALTDGAFIVGNRNLVSQAVTNLVENAVKYGRKCNGSPGDGLRPPDVRLALKVRDKRIYLTVADRGPGILPQHRARALERFGRLEASRSTNGSGLGLSLVSAIADLHDAELRLEDNAPGLAVSLEFAATDTPPAHAAPVSHARERVLATQA